jgi:hypothetical protein
VLVRQGRMSIVAPRLMLPLVFVVKILRGSALPPRTAGRSRVPRKLGSPDLGFLPQFLVTVETHC